MNCNSSGVVLTLLAILRTSVGTAAVWLAPENHQQEEAHLTQSVEASEARVKNPETIHIGLPDIEKILPLSGTEELYSHLPDTSKKSSEVSTAFSNAE